jgi:integrase
MYQIIKHRPSEAPWKKGKIVGQELPLKLHETWAIRTRLQIEEHVRDLALFNLAVDSKLRASDLVRLRVSDVATSGHVCSRATILQKKTSRPVTRDAIEAWISKAQLATPAYLFPSRFYRSLHLSTRQYARLVESWVADIGLDTSLYGTHSLRRTKASLIYRQTKNLRAIQLLLGHAKLESTVRYLGIEIDDALEMAEQTDA